MKTIKNIAIIILTTITFISCSKKEDPVPVPVPDTRLQLPAILENNTVLNVPDAVKIVATTNGCGADATPGVAENSIVIDKDGVIADASKVSVELDLTHQYATDFVVQLIAPNGESTALIKRIGATTDTGCSNTGTFVTGNKLTFNSTFTNPTITGTTTPIATGNYAPLMGTSTFPSFVPAVSLNTFFTGKNIKGTWKLKVYDCSAADLGKLNSWKLKFAAGALQ